MKERCYYYTQIRYSHGTIHDKIVLGMCYSTRKPIVLKT